MRTQAFTNWIMWIAVIVMTGQAYGVSTIGGVKIGIHEDRTRLVVELDRETRYKVSQDESKKIVLKLIDTKPVKSVQQKGKGHIKSYQIKQQTIEITTTNACQVLKAYTMPKKGKGPFRIVVDVAPVKATVTSAIPMPFIKPLRRVVVIDPGHGGHDPGTISPHGHEEKHITLAIALEMKRIIDKSGKYTAVLTRTRDEHIALRQRFSVARDNNANLLLSLHADSNPNKAVKGVSVYTLSETASDKEAERLAAKENAADFLGDLKFAVQEQQVKDVLINLSQTRARNHAVKFAEILMRRFHKHELLPKNSHRFADFAVLKAPDVASVLIELGYLSNQKDEKRLASKEYQRKIALLIVCAIDDYFEQVKS